MTNLAFLACLFTISAASSDPSPVCDPRDYGAQPNDAEPDTLAIQEAIAACEGRNGTVALADGRWETGPLALGSNMTFRLEKGAVLALIPDISLYPADPHDRSDEPRRRAIYADGVTGLAVEGPGVIEGRGSLFWDENFYETSLKRPTLPRPAPTLSFVDSREITLRNITLQNLPGFAVAFTGSSDGLAENVTIRNDPRSPNTDGIQIRNSSRIRITGADIETGDDAIVLKSNGAEIDDILVEDSRLVSDDGAIKFGTGSRIGVVNSVFRNIDIEDSRYGIAIFMIDGGHHRNNLFENIRIQTGGRHKRTYPIFVDIDRRKADRSFGNITGLTFRDVDIHTSGASLIAGNPVAKIEDLVLDNIRVTSGSSPAEVFGEPNKPRGNKNIRNQKGSVDYSGLPAEIVIAHATDVELKSVALPECRAGSDRKGLVLIDAEAIRSSVTNADGCEGAR